MANSAKSPEALPLARPGRWFALAALVLALDQLSKWLIVRNFSLGSGVRVSDFFNIVRVHNEGAAFSFLAGAGGWQRWGFAALAIGVSIFIAHLLRQHAHKRLFSLGLSLILGGALGNVVDRLMHGYVVDFLDFHWAFLSGIFHHGHYPAFNLADAAITVGAICIIADELRNRPSRNPASSEAPGK